LELLSKIAYIKYINKDDPQSNFIKGCLSINFQNFKLAQWHFLKAKNHVSDKNETFNIKKFIDVNLQFCNKPLFWINKPINKSGSTLFYILIKLFGNKRMTNYNCINEDFNNCESILKTTPMNLEKVNEIIKSSLPFHLFKSN
jgi:hypothetical protein